MAKIKMIYDRCECTARATVEHDDCHPIKDTAEEMFLKSAKKAGVKVELNKSSRRKCIYCGLGSPDFSIDDNAFHIECKISHDTEQRKIK